jgi:hypothetical protein
MTKEFEKIQFDSVRCRSEVLELRELLAKNQTLEERKNVLPFFKQRKQLSALLGNYHPGIVRYDLVAHEFPLWGDFTCDLVVGDSRNKAYAFVEFEDAAPDSIFVKRPGKATPEFSPRFEHGFSQVADWICKLDEQKDTVGFEDKFGNRTVFHLGLLVIGRSATLGKREEHRLRWRQQHVLVYSQPIYCKTFDQLCADLLDRLDQFPPPPKVEEKKPVVPAQETAADPNPPTKPQ